LVGCRQSNALFIRSIRSAYAAGEGLPVSFDPHLIGVAVMLTPCGGRESVCVYYKECRSGRRLTMDHTAIVY